MIGGRRPLHGRKVADRRIRVERPHAPYFRYAGAGQLIAREAASRPRTGNALVLARLRGGPTPVALLDATALRSLVADGLATVDGDLAQLP